MVVLSLPIWPNLFFTNLVLNKTWNTTVRLFSRLNEFQTVCRAWELPKQRGRMTDQPASVLSHVEVSWQNSLNLPRLLTSLTEWGSQIMWGKGRTNVYQTNGACRKTLDFLLTERFNYPYDESTEMWVPKHFFPLHVGLLQRKSPDTLFRQNLFLSKTGWEL